MTDAENIDWDVCPECGMTLEWENMKVKFWYSKDGSGICYYVDYCPSCGWEEGE